MTAEKKKENNIADYIIHMYRTERLLRSYEFDINLIEEHVIKHFPLSEEEKNDQRKWFVELIDRMEQESIKKEGHLNELKNEIESLQKLHASLLDNDKKYSEAYAKAKFFVDEAKQNSNGKLEGDIETCFEMTFTYFIKRLETDLKDKVAAYIVDCIGDVLSLLVFHYNKTK